MWGNNLSETLPNTDSCLWHHKCDVTEALPYERTFVKQYSEGLGEDQQ